MIPESADATSTDDALKACCAAAYSRDAVALVLGDSYHPGGLTLTRRLAGALDLEPGQRVVDVASGPGTTARLLAAEYGVTVDGVDLGEASVRKARDASARAGLSESTRFRLGDAERLPLPDESADALVCECALCTFPGKRAAAAEFARVLRPGGRAGITDVTVAGGRLPAGLTALAGWVSCIAGALAPEEYAGLLGDAGLTVTCTERHDDALDAMITAIDARIRLLRMTAPDRLGDAGIDTAAVLRYAALARQAVTDGLIGYCMLVAEKPR